jgi:threonine synthase
MRDVVATSSPSMDIQISSNFERYLFEASGRDAPLIRAKMRALRETGSFDLGSLGDIMRRDFAAAAASESDVAETIVRTKAACGYLADPHTACAIVAAERELGEGGAPQIVLSTAHPAKFPAAIEAITGIRPALPERLNGLLTAEERFTTISNDIGVAEGHVEGLTRAVLERGA